MITKLNEFCCFFAARLLAVEDNIISLRPKYSQQMRLLLEKYLQ